MDPDGHQPRGRLLVVEGTSETRYERMGCAVAAFFLVTGYGTLVFSVAGKLPWLPVGPAPLAVAPLVTSFAALLFMRVYSRRRIGKVVIYSWGLELTKQGHIKKIPWAELRGYRDDSKDFIQLVLKGLHLTSSFITVPTLEEEDRVDVLALLDRNGVPREG